MLKTTAYKQRAIRHIERNFEQINFSPGAFKIKNHLCAGLGYEFIDHSLQNADIIFLAIDKTTIPISTIARLYGKYDNFYPVCGFAAVTYPFPAKWYDVNLEGDRYDAAEDNTFWYIDILCSQKAGFGTKLFEAIEVAAEKSGQKHIRLNAVQDSIQFWLKKGFTFTQNDCVQSIEQKIGSEHSGYRMSKCITEPAYHRAPLTSGRARIREKRRINILGEIYPPRKRSKQKRKKTRSKQKRKKTISTR
jgi:hypothetical protein